jgi:glutamine amidotransferase
MGAVQTVAVVDYGLANIKSVVNALECFPVSVKVAERPDELQAADKIVLPGVGSFDAGMRGLEERRLREALHECVVQKGRPFLGICLGFQFLFEASEEGAEAGLGWVAGRILRFDPDKAKVPHIGWTEVDIRPGSRLFEGIHSPSDFYFVHSYHAPDDGDAARLSNGRSEHGLRFVASLEKDNVFAVQFHPEKSQLAGMKLIGNFLAL